MQARGRNAFFPKVIYYKIKGPCYYLWLLRDLFPLFMSPKEISTGADSGNHFAPKGCRVVLFRTKLIGVLYLFNGCGLRECFSFPVGVRLESFFIIL